MLLELQDSQREEQETTTCQCKKKPEPALFVLSNHFVSEGWSRVRAQAPCNEQTGELMFSVRQGWKQLMWHLWQLPSLLGIHSTVLYQYKVKTKNSGEAELEKSLGFRCPYLKAGYCHCRIFTMYIIKPLSASWTGNQAVWCLSYHLNDC